MDSVMKKVINFFSSFLLFLVLNNAHLFAAGAGILTEKNFYTLQEFDEAQKTSIRIAFECIRERTPEKLQDPIFTSAIQHFVTSRLNPEQIGGTIIGLDMSGEKLKAAGFIHCLKKVYEKESFEINISQIGAIFMSLVAIEDLSIFCHPNFSDGLEKLITAKTTLADIDQHIANLAILTRRALLQPELIS